jgi:hypothetical protein
MYETKVSSVVVMDGTAGGSISSVATEGSNGIKCQFEGSLRCTGMHPPIQVQPFGDLPHKERNKIIQDNNTCPFFLSHRADQDCFGKGMGRKSAAQCLNVQGSMLGTCMN